ncbi:MAG: WG repeat-containing protein [Cyanobacteriota/Melainabacteria group bacterium]
MNRELKIVIPEIFDKAGDFSEGLAPVEFEGGYGFIDRGRTVQDQTSFCHG